MTESKLIEDMAREYASRCGWEIKGSGGFRRVHPDDIADAFMSFYRAVAFPAIRERCAATCEDLAASVLHPTQTITDRCASAIRALELLHD